MLLSVMVALVAVERVGWLTLMAGTGVPAGQPEAPSCSNANGCPDNRVILVDPHGRIVWQYAIRSSAISITIGL